MRYKLLALDMDGTVLTPDQQITPNTVRAINEALDAGFDVVFCSGRNVAEMRQYLGLFPKLKYIICNNGARAVDLQTGEEISFFGMERWVTDRIMAEAKNRDLMIQIGVGDVFYMQDWALERGAEFGMGKYVSLHRETAELVPDLLGYYETHEFPICKINFYCTDGKVREEIVSSLYTADLPVVYESGVAGNIEMVSDRAGKGAGLSELCRCLEISPERVIAVGDNNNDASMLKVAGLGIAMGNAVPELKAVADAVTDDNTHEGVAAVIRKYMLGELQ